MGQLANVSQGLVAEKPEKKMRDHLKRYWPRMVAVMPKHMTPERTFQLFVTMINSTPMLAECSIESVMSCIMKCSALGLEPSAVDGLGMAYILPFKNWKTKGYEATFIIGYRGLIELARRSGQLKSIHAQAVYEGDSFKCWEDETGQHFKFDDNPNAEHSPEKLTAVFMTAHLKDGGFVFEKMTKAEVDAIRQRSKAKDNGPWKTDYEAMALKTVIRRAARYLPMATEMQRAVMADETTPDFSGIMNPIIEVPVESQEAVSDAVGAPMAVDAQTGEILPQNGSEMADEDIPWPEVE